MRLISVGDTASIASTVERCSLPLGSRTGIIALFLLRLIQAFRNLRCASSCLRLQMGVAHVVPDLDGGPLPDFLRSSLCHFLRCLPRRNPTLRRVGEEFGERPQQRHVRHCFVYFPVLLHAALVPQCIWIAAWIIVATTRMIMRE